MGRNPSILRECPVCGRPLCIDARYVGCDVVCRHCGGRLRTGSRTAVAWRRDSSGPTLLERADRLLQAAGFQLARLA